MPIGAALAWDSGIDAAWQASEFLIRPLTTVFRVAREHGLMVALDIEVDAAGRPTGRVVVNRTERLCPRIHDASARMGNVPEQELGYAARETVRAEQLCTVSHTRSIANLRLSELSSRPTAMSHGVELTPAQTKQLTDRLSRAALHSGERTAEGALRWGRTDPGRGQELSPHERITQLVYRILTRRQFRRGSLSGYPLARAAADMLPSIRRGEPIHLVFPALPIKQADSGLKAFGTLPDLAEFGFLARIKELATAISGVYRPGARFTVLNDGRHYRVRPAALVKPYAEKIQEYIRVLDGAGFISYQDMDDAAAERLGTGAMRERPALVRGHVRALTDAYRGLDVTAEPTGALRRSRQLDPAGPEARGPVVADLFPSIVHSVPVDAPAGADGRDWSRRVYAELYETGATTPPELAAARRVVLRTAWEVAIRYVAVLRTDRGQGYEEMFGARIRLSANSPSPGRCGFAGLGGSALLPWHGTGAADRYGVLSADFAISLLDRAFVPVYAEPLGGAQPWFMAPVTAVEPPDDGSRPARLSDGFLDTIRLRRG